MTYGEDGDKSLEAFAGQLADPLLPNATDDAAATSSDGRDGAGATAQPRNATHAGVNFQQGDVAGAMAQPRNEVHSDVNFQQGDVAGPSTSYHFGRRDLAESLAGLSIQSNSSPSQTEVEVAKIANYLAALKNIYQEHSVTAAMTSKQADEWRKSNNVVSIHTLSKINCSAPRIPNPILTLDRGFFNYPEIMRTFARHRFYTPGIIQAQVWPILLSGHSLVAVTPIGAGKTLAYLLPAILHIDSQPRSGRFSPSVLVLAPTLPLAILIECQAEAFKCRGIKGICIPGGVRSKSELKECIEYAQIIITTPERFKCLIDCSIIDIKSFTYVVIDEADNMIKTGAAPIISKYLKSMRDDLQIVMTFTSWCSGASWFSSKCIKHSFEVKFDFPRPPPVQRFPQTLVFIDEGGKFNAFMKIVRGLKCYENILVFCNSKLTATQLSDDLFLMGIPCGNVFNCHSILEFNNGIINILIATDRARCGSDVNYVTYVLNYDFPCDIKEYNDRIGRTGFVGPNSTLISYLMPTDWDKADDLIAILKHMNISVPPELLIMSERFNIMRNKNKTIKPPNVQYRKVHLTYL